MSPTKYPAVVLTQPIEHNLRRGHPWIFADALRLHSNTSNLKAGDVVDVLCSSGTDIVARGLYEPDSPIRVRVWTTNPHINLDNHLLEARIKAAAKRRPFPTPDTNAFRLLNGESDRTPGLTCDLYNDLCVLRVDGLAAERWIKSAVRIIKKIFNINYVVIRRSERYRETHAAAQWYGKEPPQGHRFTFLENGLRYLVNPIDGQKTGFFLDQRANRQRLADFAKGKRLLNLFSYSGGFSLAAAHAGAVHTTSVDLSQFALDDAKTNFTLNDIPPHAHHFEKADVLKYLDQFASSSAPFEVAVCDPPSFAHKRDDLDRATNTYIHLFSRLIEIMPNGSKCAFASCSSQIDRARFLDIIAHSGMRTNTNLISLGLWSADVDHPTLIGFPEGDYLQFTIVSLDKS